MTLQSDAIEKAAAESIEDTRIAQGMQAMKFVRSRRSIRHFTGEKIPDDHIELILEAVRHAPSPENMLMIRLIVIRDDQEMKDMPNKSLQRTQTSRAVELYR